MKTITLIHCYSDQNRGDAGIIEATVDLIKDIESTCKVQAVSVFHEKDKRYKREHHFTKQRVFNVYPSLFPEPDVQKEGRKGGAISKAFMFFLTLLKNIVFFIFPSERVARAVYSKRQYETYKILNQSDYIISKGGSFLYSYGKINSEFFLMRMLFTILIPLRMGKKVAIFGQSVGPLEGYGSRKFLQYVLGKIDFIFLRESECKKYLSKDIQKKVKVIPDAAFYLKPNRLFQKNKLRKVAITARPHRFSSSVMEQSEKYAQYILCLTEMAKHCLSQGYEIHLIGQVTGPSVEEDDREALQKIYSNLLADAANANNVIFWGEEDKTLTPKELQELYGNMKLLIGTRLHSSIFALTVSTPTINIAYHGTKSLGVMKSLGLGEYVMRIDNMNLEEGKALIDRLLLDNNIVAQIEKRVAQKRELLFEAMKGFLVS